jgi:PAS domain S-box-containing protein
MLFNNKFLQHYNNLSLDKRVTYSIILILTIAAFLEGILNFFFGLQSTASLINFFGGLFGLLLIVIEFYGPKLNIIKVLFILGINVLAIFGWFYNSLINSSIFFFAIIIYSIGIFNKNYVFYYLMNFVVYTTLLVLTFLKPSLIKYNYENQNIHFIDILSTYLIISFTVVAVIRIILKSYQETKIISDTRKKQLEIREKEFESILENSPDIIVRVDSNFRYVYLNKSVEKTFGVNIRDYLGKTEFELHGKDERNELIINSLEKAKKTKKEVEFEGKINTPSGVKYYQTRIVPEFDSNKDVSSYLAVTRDVTSHRLAENLLRQSEIKFRNLLNISPLPLAEVDKDENIIFINKACTSTFGYEIDDITTLKEWWKKAHPDPEYRELISSEWKQELKRSKNSGTPFNSITTNVTCKDNSKKTVVVTASFFEDKSNESYLVALYDITEQKKYEQALKNINELFSLFIKNSPIYAYIKKVTEKQSIVMFASDSFQEMIGYKGSEIVGKNMYELFPEEFAKRITEDDIQVIKNGEILKIDENFKDLNYTTYKFPITIGNEKLLAGYTIDITDKIKNSIIISEQNAELIKLNADKDQFMSILAHDLKNPFNSLLGVSDLLLSNVRNYDIERIEKQVKIIQRTSHNTFNLLEDLLLWSRSQAGKLSLEPQNFILSEITVEVIDVLKTRAEEKGITINSFDNEAMIYADKNMLKTVIRNLLSNAIKFSHEGGIISIYSTTENMNVITSVLDNGIGMSTQNIERIWDSDNYHTSPGTANEKGTGIGLKLCKDLIEKNGGKIWVETALIKGSEFKFSLPAGRI